MTPLRLSHIWYRRLYVALGIIALTYVVLFMLQTFDLQYIPELTRVNTLVGIAALLVFIACIVLFIKAKSITSYMPAYITYLVFAVATGFLTQQTGGIESGFLVIWALTVFIAPLFGAYGWLPIIVMTGSYIAGAYLSGGLPTETLILVALSSIVPLAAGLFAWHESSEAEDTTTRDVKHLANQLSEVATKSEIVINAIGDGVIAIDGQGVVQLINPAAQEILGWGKQDALMLNYKSILKLTDPTGKDLDPTQDPLQQVLNTNQQARGGKLNAVTNSGKKISVAIVASPIGDPGSGAIAVFRDVTNERAEEREQAEFISTASHEMRTPVASIEGYLGLALNPQTATIDTKARDFIMKAHEAAQHLGRLFQDLLDVSKSEDGRMTNIPRVLDVVPFTETIVQGLTQKAADKGLALKFIPSEGNGTERGIKKVMPMYYVNLDNDHIREVLDNLIENAIKYTPQGSVSVDVNGTEDKVVVSIKDTGLGIPTEDIPHLFQKFYRVNNMDRQSIGGTGLGLYLCRRLVEGMQGRLWVESTFGSGSTFFVELPRIDSQEAARLKEEQSKSLAQPTITPATQAVTSPAPTLNAISSAPSPVASAAPAPATAPTSIPVTYAAPPAPAPASAPTLTPPAPQAAPAPIPQPAAAATAQPLPQPMTQPAQPQPIAAPVAAPAQAPAPQQPQPAPQPTAPPSTLPQPTAPVQPATTVPRGETLTREQINERVRQLEALAQQQRGSVTPQTRQ